MKYKTLRYLVDIAHECGVENDPMVRVYLSTAANVGADQKYIDEIEEYIVSRGVDNVLSRPRRGKLQM